MSTQQRPRFLASLNTTQRVIIFIAGLIALALIAYPPWTCTDPVLFSSYRPDMGHAFLFNWPSGCHGDSNAVWNFPRLLGYLTVPTAIALLGYFVFKKPVPQPAATTSAPTQPTASASTSQSQHTEA